MRGSSQGCISLKCNSHLTHKVKTFCELYKDLPSRGNQCEKVVVRMRRVFDDVCGPNIIWMLAVLCDDIMTLSLCSLSAAGIPNQNAIAEYFHWATVEGHQQLFGQDGFPQCPHGVEQPLCLFIREVVIRIHMRYNQAISAVCRNFCCSFDAVFDKFEWNSYFSNRRFCFSKELLTQSSVYFSLCFLPIEYIIQRHSVSIHYFCWWHSDIATYLFGISSDTEYTQLS